MRQIILDTETTGLKTSDGHRIIEIGCVELIDRRLTRNNYQQYLNPEREIEQGALAIHGISLATLAQKPLFGQIVDEFLKYIEGAELIIHNAEFDLGFLNYELKLAGRKTRLEDICQITDTLKIARKKYPGQRNSLDALCKRLNVDNTARDLHGALLDSEILADVYLLMTGGQFSMPLTLDTQKNQDLKAAAQKSKLKLKIITPNTKELEAHNAFYEKFLQ